MDLQLLEQLITIYLTLNTKPKDLQVHNLAYSVGLSKEELEEVMYQMMANQQQQDEPMQATSEATDVLEDNYDEDTTSVSNLALNDGAANTDYAENQELLLDDGANVEEVIDLSTNVNDLTDDGAVLVSGSVLTESLLGSLDPVVDSLMHGLLVLQKARPVIVKHNPKLGKQLMNTIAAVKDAVNEVKILVDEIEE